MRTQDRHRKDMVIIEMQNKQSDSEELNLPEALPDNQAGKANKTCTFIRYTPEELKELVLAAQAFDDKAIEALCEAFKALVLRESHWPSIIDRLGEYAVSIAWVIFLELIKKYDDDDFEHLPGLIRSYLHYALVHAATNRNTYNDELGFEEILNAIGYSPMDKPTFKMAYKQAYATLSDKEKIVLGYCYNCMFTQEETALMMGCDARTVRRYKTIALNKLKKALA